MSIFDQKKKIYKREVKKENEILHHKKILQGSGGIPQPTKFSNTFKPYEKAKRKAGL